MTPLLMATNSWKRRSNAPVNPFWEHENLGRNIAEEFYSKFQEKQSKQDEGDKINTPKPVVQKMSCKK